ncbi:MAG TPA: acetylglutamate kinase, partial [Spirochaetia bacterium]|nr:acetylglutamate kinase [Spirochaetia bacterium]
TLIRRLDEHSTMENIENGTISGGMIPKVRASLDALRAGVGSILIGQYSEPGELRRLLDGEIGSRVVLAPGV